jgi:hypothetical protein
MMVILGAAFTFLAIAYSTTRAATQGSSIGTTQSGAIRLDTEQGEDHGLVTNEPSERRRMRAEALQAAVDAGYSPPSKHTSLTFVGPFQNRHLKNLTMKIVFIKIPAPKIPLIEMMKEDPFNINIRLFILYSSLRHVILHVFSQVGTQ